MSELMSINEAAKLGRKRLRLDKWANDYDHIEIYITEDGLVGPWVKLWSPVNELIEQENPQTMLVTMIGDVEEQCWRNYVGPVGVPWKPAKRKGQQR